jgi:hypothetical protein
MFTKDGTAVATAPEQTFVFGYDAYFAGQGAFTLTTEFTLDLTRLQVPGAYSLVAFVDRQREAVAPLVIMRRS